MEETDQEHQYQVNILVVDDDDEARFWNQQEVKHVFQGMNTKLNIKSAGSLDEMLSVLREESFHVLLLDRDLGKNEQDEMIDGIDSIPQILEIQPNVKVLVVTSFKDTELAVKAIKNGAMDFLSKGEEPHEIEYRYEQIRRALRDSKFEMELLKREFYENNRNSIDFAFKSSAMKELYIKLKMLSEVNTPVLILGDSGLGKTHAAQKLGQLSKQYFKQSRRAFVDININALPENLVESELFGAEKGAYTSLSHRKQGLFELAEGGDIFLDEIGDASLDLQGKLLKVIEQKSFRRIGGEEDLKVNARIIFATNKNLKELVKQGKFREDLYARISIVTLQMPDLKDRKEDIPFIIESIAKELSEEHKKKISYRDFPKPLKDYFRRDNIPFNIRGIKSDLVRLAIFCKTNPNKKSLDYSKWRRILSTEEGPVARTLHELTIDDLADLLAEKVVEIESFKLNHAKELLEKYSVQKVVQRFNKNFSRARALGLSDASASIKIKKHSSGAAL